MKIRDYPSISPNTIAACMAQSIAEFMGGIVIAQTKRPGTPSIMGVGYGPMDFKIGTFPYNGPKYYMCKVLNKEIAAFYGLPDWSYGGLTDAKILARPRQHINRTPALNETV